MTDSPHRVTTATTPPGDTPPVQATAPASGAPTVEKRLAFEVVRRRLFEHAPAQPVRLGRFVVQRAIGRGGMGTVFEAVDESLERPVAIKLLHQDMSVRHVNRLRREAQALAKLSHPNVVQIFDVGLTQGRWFIAMELIEGQTLRRWQAGEHEWRARIHMYLQAGRGLAAAHAAGLVHRDFKPDNCIVDPQGRLRVLDFGLARDALTHPRPASSTTGARVESAASTEGHGAAPIPAASTRTGAVLGTHGYVAPEQFEGAAADHRSDQFSFCVSLHEALYGEHPFVVDSTGQLLASAPGPAPRSTAVPEGVRTIVARGLSIDPDRRWPSMDALLTALHQRVDPAARRWSWWLGLGLATLLMAAGVGVASRSDDAVSCEHATDQLTGVWDEPRKQEVRAAILATALPYAGETWERVEASLDDYAEAWGTTYAAVCEAAGSQRGGAPEATDLATDLAMDLGMSCLRRRRVALQQIVDVLANANTTRVENAMDLVTHLPVLSRCHDADALQAELPPPEDPQIAERVERLRERLQRASSLETAGEYDQSLAVVDPVVGPAQDLGYPPLLAEALIVRGYVYWRKGEYVRAEQDLERGYLLAIELGHQGAAEAAVALVSVVGSRQARYEPAMRWGQAALAMARRHDVPPWIEASARRMIGSILADQGELDEALAYHQRALAIVEGTPGAAALERASVLHDIGTVLLRQGDLQGSLSHYQRAMAINEQLRGSKHPYTTATLTNIGILLRKQGQWDEALVHLERALALEEQSLGPNHSKVGSALNNIGSVQHQQGRLDEALDTYRRALAIYEVALGEHPMTAATLNNIGLVLQDQGQLDEALRYLRRALAVKRQVLDPRHPDVAVALTNLGDALLESGAHDDARPHYQQSLEILEQALGPAHAYCAYPSRGLAAIALTRGQLDRARAHAERALVIGEATQTTMADLLAASRFVLARALWPEPTERARAHALARQAREGFATLGGESFADELAEIDAWLAEHPAQSTAARPE